MKRTLAFSAALLTMASLANAQPPREGQPPRGDRPEPPNPVLMIFDADQDGILSKDEIAKAADSLAKLDANENGTIEADELPRPPRPQFGNRGPGQGGRPGFGGGDGRSMSERMLENDKNGDKKLAKDEMPERFPQQFFDRFDEDKDGFITETELKAAEERFSRFRRDRGNNAEGGRRPGQGDRRPGGDAEGRRPRRPGGEGGEDGERRPRRPERPDA